MNKLELKKFKKMSKEQIKYISDNAMLCLDYMQFDQVSIMGYDKPPALVVGRVSRFYFYEEKIKTLKEYKIVI